MATTEIAKRDPRIDALATVMNKNHHNLAQIVPAAMKKHMTPERIVKMVLAAASRSPKLLECSPMSVLKSCMTATQLGLECDGVLGGAYLVPYYNGKARCMEAQFIIGYRGLIELARRSGNISSIEAHVVRRGDKFRCSLGTEGKIEHEPDWEARELGEMFAVYAVAKFRDGGMQFEVMTKAQVDDIRKSSKAGDFGPWKDHYDEMARKTVVRRLCKYLPLSVEMRQAFVEEDSDPEEPRISDVGAVAMALGETIDGESQVTEDLPGTNDGGVSSDLSAVFDAGSQG